MTTVFFDSKLGADERRDRIYDGDLFVWTPTANTEALVGHARSLTEDAFGDLDPRTAQHELPVDAFVAILAELKPTFIHHARSKELLQAILVERGCDPDLTYFDVPRLRTACAGDYLTTGIAYAFHPHRDTWYSAPMTQINWWLPVYPVHPDNVMAFHPQHMHQGVRNGSHAYNYAKWVATSRADAAKHVGQDTREQPHAEEPVQTEPDVRVVAAPGSLLAFSGAQLHSTVENTTQETRFSIDFRSIHLGDSVEARGAENVDSNSTGTTMGDYLRVRDLAHVPDEVIEQYEPGHPQPPKLATS